MVIPFLGLVVLIALESGVLGAGLPHLMILDADGLIQTKQRLQNRDPAFAPRFTKLKADAARALDIKPLSVIEKNLSPPSGDKHDYMLDFDGRYLGGENAPPYEWPIHACIFKARPDVMSICHTHSKWSSLFSILRGGLPPIHMSIRASKSPAI